MILSWSKLYEAYLAKHYSPREAAERADSWERDREKVDVLHEDMLRATPVNPFETEAKPS